MQHLLKAVSNTQSYPHQRLDQIQNGWGQSQIQNHPRARRDRLFNGEDNSALALKMRALGVQMEELQSSNDRIGVQLYGSAQASQRASQVISANDFEKEQQHPMILSNINNANSNIDRIFVMRIRNATSDLRQAYIDLNDYIELQRTIFQDLKEHLSLQFQNFAKTFMQRCMKNDSNEQSRRSLQRQIRSRTLECQKVNRQLQECRLQLQRQQQKSKGITIKLNNKPLQQQKPNCIKCKSLQLQNTRINQQLKQIEEQYESLLINNDHLQEHIFDIQQKIVGVDLQVEKRLKEKLKTEKKTISPIKEDSKEIIDQLQSEIVILQEKCRRFESQSLQQSNLRDRERKIRQAELQLEQKDNNLKTHVNHLQEIKEANYQREHQILVAQENLSKKIADFRKKEAELSEWEAELTRKARENRGGQRDNTLANQFPSNEMSLQNSHEDLNRSGQISLKSFGKNNAILDHRLKGSPSQQQLDYGANYKMRTLDNYEEGDYIKRPHEFVHERQNYPIRPTREERTQPVLKLEGKRYGDSSYIPKQRDHANDIISKKYNPQISGYKDSREASPYRNINQARGRPYQHPPKASPNHYREISKNSRSSTSKSKLVGQLSGRGLLQRDNQVGGLGSKLQRLREQIKKEIDSIK